MNYFVVMPGGERFGPATLAQLNQWIQEGRVLQTTTLQNAASGQVLLARDLPGLVWTPQAQAQPMVDPYGSSSYQQNQAPYLQSHNIQQSFGHGSPTPTPYSQYGQRVPGAGDNAATISIVLSVVGQFLCLCTFVAVVTNIIALVLAYHSRNLGSVRSRAALILAWTSLLISIGIIVAMKLITIPTQ